jgi:hypothetical protein
MSIGKRIAEALDKFHAGDAEAALIPVSIAVDATAQKLYGTQGGKSYKDFLAENFQLVTKVALGVQVMNMIVGVPPEFIANWPQVKVDAHGGWPIQDVLYHVVRCGLLHGAELHPKLIFHKEQIFQAGGANAVRLPASLIDGLVVAVVACPANKGEKTDDKYGMQYLGYQIQFNSLWGKKTQLMKLFDALDEFWKEERREARQNAISSTSRLPARVASLPSDAQASGPSRDAPETGQMK